MSEKLDESRAWQESVYATQIDTRPEADEACTGIGDYFATSFCAIQADEFAFITLHIGNYLPHKPDGTLDYDGIVDISDRYLTNYYGSGRAKYLANGVSIRKDCYDYDHDDGITTDQKTRTQLARREHVASIAVVSELSPYETLEDANPLRLLGRIGIWFPRARVLEVTGSVKVAKSLRGGDTSVAFLALPDDAIIMQRPIVLPDGIMDEEAMQRVIDLRDIEDDT